MTVKSFASTLGCRTGNFDDPVITDASEVLRMLNDMNI